MIRDIVQTSLHNAGRSIVLRNILKFLPLFLLLVMLPACYHMRVEAEPIADRIFFLTGQPKDALKKIRRLVEDDWNRRVLQTNSNGMILITAPYDFATDTGFGQPPGGRKYSTQLRIEIQAQNETATVHLSHYNLEIRTSYAYSEGGRLDTLTKHYPYEKYPGMFDLDLINREMDRAAADIRRLFVQEHK